MDQIATGRPRFWLQDLLNLLKSELPPEQECQIAHLGTLATPMEATWHQGLAADTSGVQRSPKCDSNSSQICHQASKKTSTQASKHFCAGRCYHFPHMVNICKTCGGILQAQVRQPCFSKLANTPACPPVRAQYPEFPRF